ncbi:MAG: exo-alpha-sialidase [Opitutus sp.]
MISRFAVLTSILFSSASAWSAEEDAPVFTLPATVEHPRSSEGSFATLRSGRIIYCFSQFLGGNSDFSPCRVVQIESDDEGRTWSQPHVLFSGAPKSLEMSVSLLRLASGKLACFTLTKHGLLDCRPYLRISDDDGATWSAPRSLLDVPGYFVMNNDRVIQTKTGRLIMPMAWHRGLKSSDQGLTEAEGIDLRGIALWYYSDDEGATWKEAKTWWAIPVVSRTGLQEPGVVELADGSLLSWARTDQGSQYGFRSRDIGQTWTAPQPLTLRSPAAPASIVRLPGSSDLLAAYIDHSGQFSSEPPREPYRRRTPLVAAISSDGGVTWETRKLIEGDPRGNYNYVAIHFTADAALFAYWCNSSDPAFTTQMKIRRLSLARLTERADSLSVRAEATLERVMQTESSWIKIHAAEALVVGGRTEDVREQFKALVPTINSLAYRVGVWRVLARTSPTFVERAAWVAEVEKVFLDPASPDRSQALETLGKLRHQATGQTLEVIKAIAVNRTAPLRGLALWSLRVAGVPGALESLIELLHSPESGDRLIAAYALRLLGESDPKALESLARAAQAESTDSRAYPYLVSAAFATNADPARATAWRSALTSILQSGSDAARFEACQGLLGHVTMAERAGFADLLDSHEMDTQVGAALVILHTATRR